VRVERSGDDKVVVIVVGSYHSGIDPSSSQVQRRESACFKRLVKRDEDERHEREEEKAISSDPLVSTDIATCELETG